jgi:dTDP-4-dehydrorhamnose reductase
MIKVLIIGAKGMLGQELALQFKDIKKYEVTAWDKENIDITSEKQTKEKIIKLSPDLILNAAAYNAVDKCEKDAKEYTLAKKINGNAPGYLAKIATKINATLVHYSTDYVFNGIPEITEPAGCGGSCGSCSLHNGFVPEIGFKEDSLPDPISKYGKSKLLGEDSVIKYGQKYYIIRLSKLFGKSAQSKDAKKSFFEAMLSAGENPPADGKEVKAVDEETSCFTYAPDLAKKTKEILEKNMPYGIYHLTNSDPCTWFEAAVELYKQAKIKIKVTPVSADEFLRPAQRPYVSILINTKTKPMRSWKLALKEYLKDTK